MSSHPYAIWEGTSQSDISQLRFPLQTAAMALGQKNCTVHMVATENMQGW